MTTRTFGTTALTLAQADLTTLSADALVNAANAALAGGGGVDGAIHRAGGPSILAACQALPVVAPGVRCPTGEVRSTPAGDLDARYVIHAVGPVFDQLTFALFSEGDLAVFERALAALG